MNYYGYTVYPNGDILGLMGIMLKHIINENGYHKIHTYINKKSKTWFVHRLVAMVYLDNPENKPTVDHIDDNPDNNDLTNLQWATMLEQSHKKTKMMKNNKTGIKGVNNDTRDGRNLWYAKLNRNGIKYYKKCETKEEAIAYRKYLEETYIN